MLIKSWTSVLAALFLVAMFGAGCSQQKQGQDQMQEIVDNFANKKQREEVIGKYDPSGIVPRELFQCDMTKPVITKSEKREGLTFYTLESRVQKCEHSPTAEGTTRIFTIGWDDKQITKFEWGGPKGGKVEY